jgi:GntR family transcriptional repressor for pyruvate dehydrogenase complex
MHFKKIKKDAVPEKIIARILTLIRERKLNPGDKLPPERELAELIGVSRSSLREALRALATLNVIDIRQGDGTYITSVDPKLFIENLDIAFFQYDHSFLDLCQIRGIIEPQVAALAAEKITSEEISKLESLLQAPIETEGDYRSYIHVVQEVHEKIARTARNPILNQLMKSIYQLATACQIRSGQVPGLRKQTVDDLRDIVAAIKTRDPENARVAMEKRIENSERLYKEHFLVDDES